MVTELFIIHNEFLRFRKRKAESAKDFEKQSERNFIFRFIFS